MTINRDCPVNTSQIVETLLLAASIDIRTITAQAQNLKREKGGISALIEWTGDIDIGIYSEPTGAVIIVRIRGYGGREWMERHAVVGYEARGLYADLDSCISD